MQIRRVLVVAALLAAAACSSNSGSSSSPSSTTGTTTGTTSGSTSGSTSGASTTASIVSGAAGLTTTAFSPNPISVHVGDSITWVNNDTIAHTSTANGGAWNSGVINPGQSFKTTMSTAGTFAYHCTIHPGMVGTVTVQ